MVSWLLSCSPASLWNESTLKGKNLLLVKRQLILTELPLHFQGRQLLRFLFFPEHQSPSEKGSTLKRHNFFPFRIDDFSERWQINLTVASPGRVSISLKSNSFGAISDDICRLLFFFFFLPNYRLERRLYVKLKDWMSNSVDSDETAQWAVSSGSVLFAKAYYYRLWHERANQWWIFNIYRKGWNLNTFHTGAVKHW